MAVLHRPHLLVIEVDPALLRALARLLEAELKVTTTDSASRGVELMLSADPAFDVVLCDLVMEGMGGRDVHAAILAGRPSLLDSILFMTGGPASPADLAFAATVPIVRKPSVGEEIRQALRGMLARRG